MCQSYGFIWFNLVHLGSLSIYSNFLHALMLVLNKNKDTGLLLDLTAYHPGFTGASVTMEDFEGKSALSIAEESGLPKMREVLYSYI